MLKVQATAWLSDSTSASAPSLSISPLDAHQLLGLGFAGELPGRGSRPARAAAAAARSRSHRPDCCRPRPARRRPWRRPAESRSAAAEVCSHGSNPRRSPDLRCCRDPALRRRIDQRFDRPGLGVDLLGRLQRVAAVDEDCGLLGQHDRQPRRAGKAGQPGQPLLGRRDILILLLIGARNDEAGRACGAPAPREAPTAAPSARRRFRAPRMSGNGLRTSSFTLGLWGAVRNVAGFDENRHRLQNPLAIMWTERFAVTRRTSNEMAPGKFQEWSQLNDEGIHHACLYV